VLEFCPEAGRFQSGSDGIRRTFEGTSLETLRQMVASGLGITVIPASAAPQAARRGDLVAYRPFASPAPSRRVVLACRRSYARMAAIEALAAIVRDCGLPGVKMLPAARAPRSQAAHP